MRKFTAIILLTAFVASQYARHISYFECKLTNYFTANTVNCDCEKLIREEVGAANKNPHPVIHNHIHPDESYCPSEKIEPGIHPADIIIYPPAPFIFLTRGSTDRIDRPPQFS